MCYIHHSITQLQVSEQLSSERNSSSLFYGASLNIADAFPHGNAADELYPFLDPLPTENLQTIVTDTNLGVVL